MSNAVMIMGDSSSGKSHSIKYLDKNTTFIIQAKAKDLPWRSSRQDYSVLTADNPKGRKIIVSDISKVVPYIKKITKNTAIKTIILDDTNYLMSDTYISGMGEKAFYDKFNEIITHISEIIKTSAEQREDLDVFIMWHSYTDEQGRTGLVSLGKFMQEKHRTEGLFTVLLHAIKEEVMGQNVTYKFATGNKFMSIAKSPEGMFPNTIPNNLQLVKQKMKEYYEPADEANDDTEVCEQESGV